MEIDLTQAMETVDGDTELLRELIADFLNDYPQQLKGLRDVLESGDADQVERRAHSLKSNVGIFGARDAYDLAYLLEQKGRESHLDGADGVLHRLEAGLADMASYLSSGDWEGGV